MISMNSLKVTTQMMNQIYGRALRTTRGQINRLEAGVKPAFCLRLANIRPLFGRQARRHTRHVDSKIDMF